MPYSTPRGPRRVVLALPFEALTLFDMGLAERLELIDLARHARLLAIQPRRGFPNLLLELLRLDHLFENLVLDAANLGFLAFDLLEHRPVLFVGLDLVKLILVLGDARLDHLNVRLQIPSFHLVLDEPLPAVFVGVNKFLELGLKCLNLRGQGVYLCGQVRDAGVQLLELNYCLEVGMQCLS
jgi:hypothetical protein